MRKSALRRFGRCSGRIEAEAIGCRRPRRYFPSALASAFAFGLRLALPAGLGLAARCRRLRLLELGAGSVGHVDHRLGDLDVGEVPATLGRHRALALERRIHQRLEAVRDPGRPGSRCPRSSAHRRRRRHGRRCRRPCRPPRRSAPPAARWRRAVRSRRPAGCAASIASGVIASEPAPIRLAVDDEAGEQHDQRRSAPAAPAAPR